jgi:hypothetical protein
MAIAPDRSGNPVRGVIAVRSFIVFSRDFLPIIDPWIGFLVSGDGV